MDEYYKLAEAYFKKFESRSAFPGLNSHHWYLWLLALCGFGYLAYQTFFAGLPSGEKPYWKLLASEVFFLFICGWIGIYRFKHTVKATSEPSDLRPIERLIIAKRINLEQLFNRPSWQFTAVVEEIAKLRKLETTYRSFMEQSLVELLSKLFSPKVLATLLTLLASLLALFFSWASKSDSFSLTALLNNHSKLELLVSLAQLSAVTAFSILATYVVLWQLFSLVPLIISSVIPVLRSDHVIINYLICDLIRCQTMPPVAALTLDKREAPPTDADAAAQPHAPSLSLLVTTICLAALTGWLSRTPRSGDNATSRNKNSDLR